MHIFILGHSNDDDRRLSAASQSRIAYAVSILERAKPEHQPVFLLSTGGFGDNFNTSHTAHHIWVEAELKKRGYSAYVRSGRNLASAHTVEDAILIREYCAKNDVRSFAVVTNKFHLARSRLVFDAIFDPVSVSVLGADNPIEIRQSDFEHESAAIQQLETQGGVLWGDDFYPLRSARKQNN